MANSARYRHIGIHLPFQVTEDPTNTWTIDDKITSDGFILVEKVMDNEYVVQSVRTGDLFVNKLYTRAENRYDRPGEVRISTAPNADCQLPGPYRLGLKGVNTINFAELICWQRFPTGAWSLYFR